MTIAINSALLSDDDRRGVAQTKHTMRKSWQLLCEIDGPSRERAEESVRRLVSTHPDATLDHDLNWLWAKSNGRERSVVAFVQLNELGEVMGYAPFFVHPSSFAFEYAARTFLEIRTRRHAITAQPLFENDADNSVEAITELLSFMRTRLKPKDVVFGLGVPLDSKFGQTLSCAALREQYLVMPHGPAYSRRLLKLPENVEAYFALLGSKTRQDLRRQERRLSKEAADDVTVTVHTTEDAVEDFLRLAAQVSQRTYQWRLHHMGVVNDAGALQHFRNIAAKGWLRCYVLHAKTIPIAFMVGYLFRDAYYSETIGYDPTWADYSVGNVLHLHVVRDLTAMSGKVQWFDFLYGDNSNKERLSTHAHVEQNFYLIPRTAKWTSTIAALRGFDAFTGSLNRALERFGAKDKLKRWLRRRATRAQSASNAD